MVIAGDTERFLERAATIQWGLMVCVYCLSYVAGAPAASGVGLGQPGRLLLFFFVARRAARRRAPVHLGQARSAARRMRRRVSPNSNLGGLHRRRPVGERVAPLSWATPFSAGPAPRLSLGVCIAGFAGGLIDGGDQARPGVEDYGTLVPGHGGVLDRIDSLCFAAPVFFHLTRFFY